MKRPLKAYFRPFYYGVRKLLAGQLTFREMAYFKSVYFSQFGEDVFLDNHFRGRTTGFYVDVGAFHPFNISNTYVFYRRGWRGINIEPNPKCFRAFPKHRPRDINLNVAVSQKDTEVTFNCLEELSGIDGESHLSRDRQDIQRCRVRTRPLAAILHEHVTKGTAIDFMSVDCEGHDLVVLQTSDWEKFRPQVVLVEDHERESARLEDFMISIGYQFERRLGLTKVFLDATVSESAAAFRRES